MSLNKKPITPTKRQGFTLLEAVFALTIFVMMGLLFAAVLPISQRTARINAHYAQSAALAQHKIAQARAAGFSSLQSPSTLASLGIIDAGSATGQAIPYTASFLGADRLVSDSSGNGLFPAGTTASIAVADYAATNAAVPAGTVALVTVTLHWPAGATTSGSYALSGLVIQMPHS